MQWREITIASDPKARLQAEREIIQAVESHGFTREAGFSIKLAMEEAVVNAMKHGNRFDRSKTVFIRYAFNGDTFHLAVRDQGAGFDYRHVPDPTQPENLMLPYGRGIMLMQAYMDHVTYNERGNEVTLVKKNHQKGAAPCSSR